jgi:xylulokinase
MAGAYFVGVDIGTYSSKGVLVHEDGVVAASASVPHGIDMPQPGFYEQDAERVWWHDFIAITRDLLQHSGVDPKRIAAVGTSAIGSCVLPVDGDGNPLRPAILYGIDTRASAEIEILERKLGKEAIFQRSGMHLSSQASGPKVLWIRRHEPQVFQKTRWFLTSQAYLVLKLTGQASIDIYTAGGYIPLYDVFKREWVKETESMVVSRDRLPDPVWSAAVVGKVTYAAALETGLAEGTPVIAGTTDAGAEAVSAGVAGVGDMLLMFGSSIFFILRTTQFAPTQHFWSANFLEENTYVLTGGMSTAGSLTTWFRDQFARVEMEQERAGGPNAYTVLAAEAALTPAGSRGLVALPYFAGERTPLHDPAAKGMWFGLNLKHTRGDLYRALLEGVAYGIRHNLEVMRDEGIQPRQILVNGGGIRNRLWMQIVADVGNQKLAVPDQENGACYGDAFLAAVGAGVFPDLSAIKEWVRIKKTIDPNLETHQQYAEYYRIFRELYTANRPLMDELDYLGKRKIGEEHETLV